MNEANIYIVGGYVRDSLMGKPSKDYDFVVVGCSAEHMLSQGFTQVDQDFPVFLHPVSGDEYALARVERKEGKGYNGFTFSTDNVTLEEDLARRDLTINSMAMKVDIDQEGNFTIVSDLIDPYNGKSDIEGKYLRPTTEAFKEDPIRVLRAARFLSRYPDFSPTMELIKYSEEIVDELQFCAKERVWQEIEKVMSSTKPSRFFHFLSHFKVFSIWEDLKQTPQKVEHHPEIWCDVHTGMVMDVAADKGLPPEAVFACLCHDFGKPICYKEYGNAFGHEDRGVPVIEDFCKEYKVPNKYRDLAILVCKYHTKVHGVLGRGSNKGMRPKSIMKLFEDTNAIQKPERFITVLLACEADARGRGSTYNQIDAFLAMDYLQSDYLKRCLSAVILLDTKVISSKLLSRGIKGETIGLEIRAARINKIREVQKQW